MLLIYYPLLTASLVRTHHIHAEYSKQYPDRDSEWKNWVDQAMYNYNTSELKGTSYMLFELIYGKDVY